MTDETTLDYVNELQAYMVHVIKLNAEIERLREALEAAPLIGRTESVFDFMERQEAWLKGPYRAAMQEQEDD